MATYQVRGSSHNIIYLYRTDDGKSKQHWETYETELEAIQRKAYIELLQKEKRYDDIRLAVLDYKLLKRRSVSLLRQTQVFQMSQCRQRRKTTRIRPSSTLWNASSPSMHGKSVSPQTHMTATSAT